MIKSFNVYPVIRYIQIKFRQITRIAVAQTESWIMLELIPHTNFIHPFTTHVSHIAGNTQNYSNNTLTMLITWKMLIFAAYHFNYLSIIIHGYTGVIRRDVCVRERRMQTEKAEKIYFPYTLIRRDIVCQLSLRVVITTHFHIHNTKN